MSFIYAEKYTITNEEGQLDQLSIYSDTKVMLNGAIRANWSKKQKENIEKYGLIKSVIVSPKCCISFAGNNIGHANKLLSMIYSQRSFHLDELLKWAYDIHKHSNTDDIEFLVCFADGDDETEIISIKNNEIIRDCKSAWIGSKATFNKMQELKLSSQSTSLSHSYFYREAVYSDADDSVGGFIITTTFNKERNYFFYNEMLILAEENEQVVPSGSSIIFSDKLYNGPFRMHIFEGTVQIKIEFELIDITILYSNKIRLSKQDMKNKHIENLLLPIVYKTSNNEII